ncbi:MAG: MBL fold metallo-hydrolase [Oscillospiraceae bacterium]
MKITWLGHSCFKVETTDGSVVFDPFNDGSVPGLKPLPRDLAANSIVCSHEHGDHNGRKLVSIEEKNSRPLITTIPTYHDDKNGKLRGESNINILEAEGLRAIHYGDIGCKLTSEQAKLLKNADVIFIPVGGFYTIDYQEALEIISETTPKIIIPMHYRNENFGYSEISTLDNFIKLSKNVKYYDCNNITITKDSPPQTAILKY